MKRVMWIEDKSSGLAGPARIGWVEVKNGGKKIVYGDQTFLSLRGRGFKSNFNDVSTKDEYASVRAGLSGSRRLSSRCPPLPRPSSSHPPK